MTARLLLMTGSALLLFAIGGFAMRAQEHEQDQNHRDQDRRDQDRRDQDQRDRERAAQHGRDRSRFDDHDRQVSRDWYNNHHDHPPVGLRDRDRLTPEYESRLRKGMVLNGACGLESTLFLRLLSPAAASSSWLSQCANRRTRLPSSITVTEFMMSSTLNSISKLF